MIDTVILTIPEKHTTFIKNSGTEWNLFAKFGSFTKHIKQLPTAKRNDGVYRPRVTVITRGKDRFLKIEFSIPKLIFENNVDEVTEKDFDKIINKLQLRLRDWGIIIKRKNLKASEVTAFHPSKNILLSDGYTSSGVIKELNKINLTRRMDLTKDTFRNEGQSLQFYTNSHSLVIYDKIADLKKPKSRAIDKEKTLKQTSLFDVLDKEEHMEILRIEVRLSKKVKMNSLLQKLGYDKNPTFQDIFNEEICQKIVSTYWQDIIAEKHLFLFSLANSPTDILKKLMQKYPTMKPKELIYLIGLQQLSTDKAGIRDLRQIVMQNANDRTWYRITDGFKKLNGLQALSDCHSWLGQVKQQIEEFIPLKVHHLLCKEK